MTNFITSSANLLGFSKPTNRSIFEPVLFLKTWFDDGPPSARTKDPSSGSININNVHPFIQGVEITRQSQYDAGIIKVWSGEPGHVLFNGRFGMDKQVFVDGWCTDIDKFNPVVFIAAQGNSSVVDSNVLTFPIVVGDNVQHEGSVQDGVVEPLTIRAVAGFFTIDVPFEAHAVRGSVGPGNVDQAFRSDDVVVNHKFNPQKASIGFLDMVDIIGTTPMNGFFQHVFSTTEPFNDERWIRNAPTAVQPSDLIASMSLMTGSTHSFVRYDHFTMPCGWYYDNTVGSTDSIAFGGMTY